MRHGSHRMLTGCAFCVTRSPGRAGATQSTRFAMSSAIQQEICKHNYLARYELRAAEAVRSSEMETLKRLEAKYRPVANQAPAEDTV